MSARAARKAPRHANVAFFVPHAGCPHRCSFCDQRAVSGARRPPDPGELRAVLAEALDRMGERSKDAEIAFFGGSFTAVELPLRLSLLETAAEFVGPRGFAGIRVSTRPDAVDEKRLAELRAHGATTVELGAQSMDDGVLARNRRGHTALQVEEASRRIKRAGLRLGLQMMTGLPGDSPDGARETARRLAGLEPDCVRIYPALTLRDTGMEGMLRRGEYTPPGLEETVALCASLLEFFAARDIPVIRLGLHDSPALRESLVAGPHHPALRELCESRLLLRQALGQLARIEPDDGPRQNRAVVLRVHPGCVSRMIGQRRANIEALRGYGYDAGVVADEDLPHMQVEVN